MKKSPGWNFSRSESPNDRTYSSKIGPTGGRSKLPPRQVRVRQRDLHGHAPCAPPTSMNVLYFFHGNFCAIAVAVPRLRPVMPARNCRSRAGSL